MAQVIRRFTVTTPAGTAKAAPQTTACKFDPMAVVGIEVVVPPGPRGELGFKIAQAGVQIFPYSPDDYLVTDDEILRWDIEGANTSGAWQVVSYNTGTFNHSIEIRFLCNLVGDATAAEQFTPLPLDALQSA